MKLKSLVKGNQLQNCPTAVSDMDMDDDIYGPQVSIPAQKRPGHAENITRFPLLSPIENSYINTSLIMDYIFINGQPYFLKKSANINFHSIQACNGQGKVELNKGLDIVKQAY